MKHSSTIGFGKYILNEKELFEISRLLHRENNYFVTDLFNSLKDDPETLKKAKDFVYFLDPSLKQIPSKVKVIDSDQLLNQTISNIDNFINKPSENLVNNILSTVTKFVNGSTNKSNEQILDEVMATVNKFINKSQNQGGYVEELEDNQLALK